jgi:hypothetical protein
MDHRDVVLGEERSNTSSVGSLITWNLIAIETRRATRNVEGGGGKLAGGLGNNRTNVGEREQVKTAHLAVHKLSDSQIFPVILKSLRPR